MSATSNDNDNDTAATTPLDEVFEVDSAATSPQPSQTAPAPSGYALGASVAAGHPAGPRIRWASVVWGAIFAASGWLTIWAVTAADRRAAFTDWAISLTAAGWVTVAVLIVGGLVLIGGVIGGLRRATRGRSVR